MQSSLTAQRSSLKTKLPDIVSALEVVNHLVPWSFSRRKQQDWSPVTQQEPVFFDIFGQFFSKILAQPLRMV